MNPPVGLFGGTFDPVHHAHLRVALDVLERLELAQIRFIPSARPPHRDAPGASAQQRLRLLQLAVAGRRDFVVDDRELTRGGPSYTVDTLRSLRGELGEQTPLCLLIGQDAFLGLPTWHRWLRLFEQAHLIVLARPGYPDLGAGHAELNRAVAGRLTDDAGALRERRAGCVLRQPVTQLAISASMIRALVGDGYSPRYLTPAAVCDRIEQQNLYRPVPTLSPAG